jgi:phosphatidylglycerophosphate synthase
MRSELSIEMRDEAAQPPAVADRDAMAVAPGSRIEQRIIDWLCEPLLQRIPARVHPNTISVITHVIAWMTAALAVGSVHLPPLQRSFALVFAGVGMLLSMIGDSLDGMHARRTNQCSKLGEMMDHWLDAIIVPLTTIGITLALQMPMWAIAIVNVTGAMVYHGQLVLYHHTGKFIHPEPATGMEAQLGLSVGYVGLAGLFYFVDRGQPWLDMAISAIALFGIYIELRCNWYYYVRLGKLMRYHATFVAMCAGFALLYLLHAIDVYAFVLALVCTSFRISGTYVLSTIVHRRFDGNDFGIAFWLVLLFAANFALPAIALGPVSLAGALPYAACVYMVARNMLDFSRHYRELKPTAAR